MSATYIAFDTSSGQITSVQHGAVDEREAHSRARQHAASQGRTIGVIAVPSDSIGRGKKYKVDAERGILIETSKGENGAGFAAGSAGSAH